MSKPKVAFLGPAGTFSEDALMAAAGEDAYEAVPVPTIHGAIAAVEDGTADRALVPYENSTEGTVRPTLDALAFDVSDVAIVGEYDHPIHTNLIAATDLDLDVIELVISHPQPLGQCTRFLRELLPQAEVRAAPSTADAVREVVGAGTPWAALGPRSAAVLYGARILRERVEDSPDNLTRFIWIGASSIMKDGSGEWRTTLCFSELGADHPGALVDALTEFSSRAVNLTKIESRPLRQGLGRYMFFADLEGSTGDDAVAEAIAALRTKAENVRVLGSYPVSGPGIP